MTAPVADLGATYYTAQAATAAEAVAATAAAWATLDLLSLDRTWGTVRSAILTAIIAGQVRAASIPSAYLGAVLAADDLEPDPVAAIPATAFAGRSAGGWSLLGPLDLAPIRVKQAVAAGRPLADAGAAGLAHVEALASTEVADAGRGAMEAAIRLEPQIIGYERYVNLPACSRCIILAGRFYKKSAGFPRHPECDCSHRPLTSRAARDGTEQDSSEMFRSMARDEQDRVFTADGARAIRTGADLNQVVNARLGMSSPGDPFTRAGRGRGRAKRSRLSPQGIARKAGDDEALYLKLLRANRYI